MILMSLLLVASSYEQNRLLYMFCFYSLKKTEIDDSSIWKYVHKIWFPCDFSFVFLRIYYNDRVEYNFWHYCWYFLGATRPQGNFNKTLNSIFYVSFSNEIK